jgi:hypothetical protein
MKKKNQNYLFYRDLKKKISTFIKADLDQDQNKKIKIKINKFKKNNHVGKQVEF